jgi:hypothetical protein
MEKAKYVPCMTRLLATLFPSSLHPCPHLHHCLINSLADGVEHLVLLNVPVQYAVHFVASLLFHGFAGDIPAGNLVTQPVQLHGDIGLNVIRHV